jgi:hypothetical protein
MTDLEKQVSDTEEELSQESAIRSAMDNNYGHLIFLEYRSEQLTVSGAAIFDYQDTPRHATKLGQFRAIRRALRDYPERIGVMPTPPKTSLALPQSNAIGIARKEGYHDSYFFVPESRQRRAFH